MLALGGLGAIGRVRTGFGRLGEVLPLPVLRLPGSRYSGGSRVGLRGPTDRPASGRFDSRHRRRSRPDARPEPDRSGERTECRLKWGGNGSTAIAITTSPNVTVVGSRRS